MHVMAVAVVVLVFAATEVVARAVVADAVVLVVMVVPDTGSKHAVAPAAMGGPRQGRAALQPPRRQRARPVVSRGQMMRGCHFV